jgi:hypothetical protein
VGFCFGNRSNSVGSRQGQQNTSGLRRTGDVGRGRRQRSRQNQATDAAIGGASLVTALVTGGRLLIGLERMADDPDGRIGGLDGSTRRSEVCEQARERNRISSDKRYEAPPYSPLSEKIAHS